MPLGGTLRLSTCGFTADNTVLYIGTGCPTWSMPFGCLVGNDDAAACGSNAFASTLSLVVTQRTYFFQLGGFNGRSVTAGLQWSYSRPMASKSSTCTRSRTRSVTRTRSRSRKNK